MRIKYLKLFLLCLVVFVVGFIVRGFNPVTKYITLPTPVPTPVPTPLAKYTISALQNKVIPPAKLTRGDLLKTNKLFTSYKYLMNFDPTLSNSVSKKVSGLLNLPNEEGKYPLVVMFRGYVDPNIYTTGVGTKNAAEFFANNGFITIAPDFLGYADSDSESGDIFETRFQTYTTAATLLNSIATPDFENITNGMWDGKNIFIWAHSNGGQVALTTLAITKESIPTTLWAPVTKPFPYNILYYTDESADGGKFIRKELGKFENIYDTDNFSFTNYMADIKGPLQFEQGTADDAVPFTWTKTVSSSFKKLGVDVTYNQYPGSDHNLRPAWDNVVAKDLLFFKKWMK